MIMSDSIKLQLTVTRLCRCSDASDLLRFFRGDALHRVEAAASRGGLFAQPDVCKRFE